MSTAGLPNSEYFTFNAGKYMPVTQPGRRVALPRARPVGEWVHIPYGSRNVWEADGGFTHYTWQTGIWIPTQADYLLIITRYGTFGSLTAPGVGGTVQALLLELSVGKILANGSYEGSATWEWAV